MSDDKPLCLLALDGGGIRGLSELVILDEVMSRIKYDLNVDGDLLPADFFDLIGGTSTGGLVALLLGRLRLSVPQARREYVRIAEEVFSLKTSWKKNAFDAQKLEDAVKRLLGKDRSEERMLEKDGQCKVFVCAVPQLDVGARGGPRLFRTYNVRENRTHNCTIWEACRATSAAPTFFEPISIGDEGERETFVDGGLGYNNPVEQVLEEAGRVFPGRKVACVVSIGTGLASVIEFPSSPKTSPIKLIHALKNMATESDRTAEKMYGRFQNVKDTYFRFSVDRGLQDTGLEEWKQLHKVRTYTAEYINQHILSEQIDKVTKALLTSKIISDEGSSTQIRLPGHGSGDLVTSQRIPRVLEWRSAGGPIPSFHLTTDQLVSPTVAHTHNSHFLIPFNRNQDFIGRQDILHQVVQKISPQTNKDACQMIALEGLGGIGKTQVALEAAFRIRDGHEKCSVFWVPAVNATTYENAHREIGQKLSLPGIENDKADVKTLVRKALSQSNDAWLLIIDNLDDTKLLFGDAPPRDFLPSSHNGSILITTRTHEVVRKLDIRRDDAIRIENMSRLEAHALLAKHLREDQISDAKSTSELLDFLADLPLAVKQASAYMDKTGTNTTRYLEHCRASDAKFIEVLSKDFEDRGRYSGTRNPVATTWLISFCQISEQSQLAAKYMRYIPFLAEKDIPQSLLPTGEDEMDTDEAIGTLSAYAFITIRPADKASYDVHRLVRLAMRNWLTREGELGACINDVLRHLSKVLPWPLHQNKPVWLRNLPHASISIEFQGHSSDQAAKSEVFRIIGRSRELLGKFHEAELMFRQAMRAAKASDNEELIIKIMIDLAISLKLLGKYDEAEILQRQALALHTESLGDEHLTTAYTNGGLADILTAQGKYEEAEAILKRGLVIYTETLGEKHPDTITAQSDFASILSRQGKHEEAEAIKKRVLVLYTETLGEKHPHTFTAQNNLAITLSGQGKYEEAEAIEKRALVLYTETLGEGHPHTLVAQSNLASTLSDQGKYEEAEAILKRILVLYIKTLGEKHRRTLVAQSNLASTLSDQGKYEEAEAISKRVLILCTETLGEKHPDTLIAQSNLASALSGQGKYEEAEAMERRVIMLSTQTLGSEYPNNITSISNLATTLSKQGKFGEAEVILRQAVMLSTKVFGREHPTTLRRLARLTRLLDNQEKETLGGHFQLGKFTDNLVLREKSVRAEGS